MGPHLLPQATHLTLPNLPTTPNQSLKSLKSLCLKLFI